jgi:hypothetical protein
MRGVDYATGVRNMTTWVDSLPPCAVQFLFFLASDLKRPKVREALRRVDVRGHRFYLAPGMSNNYCYAYSQGFVQYVVTPVAPFAKTSKSGAPPRAYDVTINASGPAPLPPVSAPRILAEHGKHLDFAVFRTRGDGLVIKSHLTNYTENDDDTFVRSVYDCNFRLSAAAPLLGTDAAFDGCLCEAAPVARPHRTTVGDVYDAAHANMLRLFCSKVAGVAFSGGGWKRVRSTGVTGAGQRGGSAFLTDGFVDFVARRLLQQIATLRPDLETALVFYDEADEVAEGSSANIVVWYDFVDHASAIFQLDAATAFAAHAAEGSGVRAAQTTEQTRCLERFAALERQLLVAVGPR